MINNGMMKGKTKQDAELSLSCDWSCDILWSRVELCSANGNVQWKEESVSPENCHPSVL